jgi:hypothetical protein
VRLSPLYRSVPGWLTAIIVAAVLALGAYAYLSVQELLALRAKAVVAASAPGSQPSGTVHTISRPLDGSRFVISTVSPSALSRHNAVYLAVGALLLVSGVAGLVLAAVR